MTALKSAVAYLYRRYGPQAWTLAFARSTVAPSAVTSKIDAVARAVSFASSSITATFFWLGW